VPLALALVGRRHGGGEQPLHVLAQARSGATRSAEFGLKSMELAKVYESDHGALTAKQAAERAKLVQTWDKAKAALVAQIEPLEAQLAEEKAAADKLAAEKAAAKEAAQAEAAA